MSIAEGVAEQPGAGPTPQFVVASVERHVATRVVWFADARRVGPTHVVLRHVAAVVEQPTDAQHRASVAALAEPTRASVSFVASGATRVVREEQHRVAARIAVARFAALHRSVGIGVVA